jgi:hypothetical protein
MKEGSPIHLSSATHFQNMVLSPIVKNSGFVAEVPFQFCSYERIAHDDKYQANDENVIFVFHHAIERGQDAHNKDDDNQSFSLHCISL